MGAVGWRLEKRKPIQISVKINDFVTQTKDISPTGVYADYANSDLQPNQKVSLEFSYLDNTFSLESGIVRVDPNGIGIAFRNLNKENETLLNTLF